MQDEIGRRTAGEGVYEFHPYIHNGKKVTIYERRKASTDDRGADEGKLV